MSKRILIADDDDDALAGLANLLTAMGHEVALAGNGAQAVEVAAQFAPDVVILDLGMPMVDGLAAARELRLLPHGHAIMLVALTGWGQPQHREMTLDAGFDVHLVKPIAADQLQFILSMTQP
ncbi:MULTISPECIES: response regulator [unclassified Caballeronia]|uniref:response regulator n=1 Tax=unclassified Caballeronia TaxID=2646786 RepID=UPI00285BE3D2|nr:MULTISPECIES: response regulator [unclassified Caballeronia]MDR5814729.1 response regulator [Caballeronia sp. LZ033]MDR5821211.1 response regulator [Caballeronia sp. LZ043]MDR5879365.1 response regulator [Caballeronia sp. LZ032]